MTSKDMFKKIVLINKLESPHLITKVFYKLSFKVLNIFLLTKISLYNGRFFSKLFLNLYRKGFKFGEFVWTRKMAFYKNKQKKKKLKKIKK